MLHFCNNEGEPTGPNNGDEYPDIFPENVFPEEIFPSDLFPRPPHSDDYEG